MNRLIVTGAAGLIGSEVVSFFAKKGWEIVGIDNNMRADFFGKGGDTSWNTTRLKETFTNYTHYSVDIRHREKVIEFIHLSQLMILKI